MSAMAKKYWKADYLETDWPREPFERARSSSDQIRACHAAVHMSPYGPTLPSAASAGHGSYLGISCRHWGQHTTAEDDPKATRAPLPTTPSVQRMMSLPRRM